MEYGGGVCLCCAAKATVRECRFGVRHMLNAGPVCDELIMQHLGNIKANVGPVLCLYQGPLQF